MHYSVITASGAVGLKRLSHQTRGRSQEVTENIVNAKTTVLVSK